MSDTNPSLDDALEIYGGACRKCGFSNANLLCYPDHTKPEKEQTKALITQALNDATTNGVRWVEQDDDFYLSKSDIERNLAKFFGKE